MEHPVHYVTTRAADIAAAGSVTTAAWINLADINAYIQIGAGLIAIVAGAAAAFYHIQKTLELKAAAKKRKEEEAAA